MVLKESQGTPVKSGAVQLTLRQKCELCGKVISIKKLTVVKIYNQF